MSRSHTLRFEVFLDSKNSESYEISLLDLIKRNKTQHANDFNKKEIDEIDNFVKELDEKYGPVAVVKGKRIRVNDFVDQGNGYDAEDPFIDDSEGEEALVVAPDLMTEHGGFFINNESLKLNDLNFVIERVEGGNNAMNCSLQSFSHKNINKKSKSQKLLSQARKRLTTSCKNKSMRRIVTNSDKKLEKVINDIVAVNKPIEVDKMEITSKILKKAEIIEVQVPNQSPEKDIVNIQVNNCVVQPTKVVELPQGLPDEVVEKVNSLITISQNCKSEGIRVSPQFNSTLFELDTLLVTNQKGMKGTRTNVLRYVSQAVDIKYDAILRRICKIKDNKKKLKLKPLFKALEDSIKEAMVESIAKYEFDMKQYSNKVEAQKSSQNISINDSQSCSMDQSYDADIDSKSKSSNKIKLPKRTFKWTLTCKSILFKLVCGELDAFRISNSKGSPEEHLNKFYQTSVLPLFPPKWMIVSQLMKLSIPLIYEFKQCISKGKEFKTYSPGNKPKPEPKNKIQPEPNLNGKVISPVKEAIVTLTNCSPKLDINHCKSNIVHPQVKKPSAQVTSSTGLRNNNAAAKPKNVANNNILPINQDLDCNPIKHSLPKSIVRSSSIIPQSRANKNHSTMTVKPIESTKRCSEGSSTMYNDTNNKVSQKVDCQGFQLIGLQSSQNNDINVSHLQNYVYPHNASIEHIKKSISVNTSNNNFVPHCSQQQPSPHQMMNIKELTHSTPYSIPRDNIFKIAGLTQNVPDISNIFTSPISIRQSIPQVITKPRSSVSQSHIPQIQALHKHYMTSIPDPSAKTLFQSHAINCSPKTLYQPQNLLSPPKTPYNPQVFGSPPMIDLTTDSSSSGDRIQVSSPLYVNMNRAHCPNGRNVNN